MGLLKKLFGKDPESILQKAEKLEQEGNRGGALIEYERAISIMEKSGDEFDVKLKEAQRRVEKLKDEIAQQHIKELPNLIEAGEYELALESLNLALEVCGSEEKKKQIEEKIERVEEKLATSEIEQDEQPISEEDIYHALIGRFTQEQIDEFDRYGDKLKKGFLSYHRGEVDKAISTYEQIISDVGEEALYLRLELAKAYQQKALKLAEERDQDDKFAVQKIKNLREMAKREIEKFKELLPRAKTPQVMAEAWSLLARIYIDEGDDESAEDALIEAQNIAAGETAVYINLGRFLLERKRLEDAIDALKQGEEIMDRLRPDTLLLQLLGDAFMKAGKLAEAAERYNSIISYEMALGTARFNQEVASKLAEIYEKQGKIQQACDLYRNISTTGGGSEVAYYNYHAARLMIKLGMSLTEVKPYIIRAKELAQDEELKKMIESLSHQL